METKINFVLLTLDRIDVLTFCKYVAVIIAPNRNIHLILAFFFKLAGTITGFDKAKQNNFLCSTQYIIYIKNLNHFKYFLSRSTSYFRILGKKDKNTHDAQLKSYSSNLSFLDRFRISEF